MSNPQPRLPTTTILELSQSSSVVTQNGDFTVQFTEPVTVNEGDQLNIKMVSIDSQDADSESIVLPLDGLVGSGSTPISIGFSYYDVNYDLETGYATNAIFRKQYEPTIAGPGTQYPIDCRPYQPYGTISESELSEVTIVWIQQYSNGKKEVHGQFRKQLNGFGIKVGFSWYEPTADGGSIFRTTDFTKNQYVFDGYTGYTYEKPKDRPTSIPVGTTQVCKLSGGLPIKFKKGTLQITSLIATVQQTKRDYPDVTLPGFNYLSFKSQEDIPVNPLFDVSNDGLTFTAGGSTFTVELTALPSDGLTNGSLYGLTGVAGTNVQAVPVTSLNREHALVSHTTSPVVLTFNIPGVAAATAGIGGGANMKLQEAGKVDLIQSTQTIQLPNGRYDRESIAAAITEGFSQVFLGTAADRFEPSIHFEPLTNLQFNTQTSEYGSIRFREMDQFASSGGIVDFDASNSYTYDRSGGGTVGGSNPVNMLIGARKFSMTYGKNGNIFQWDNGFTSVANPATLLDATPLDSETIGYYQLAGSEKYCQVNAASGIIINDMEPKQFWNDMLGLYNNCVVPLQTGVDSNSQQINYVSSNALIGNVPKGSSQLQSFTPLNGRFPLSTNAGVPTNAKPLYTDIASVPPNPVLGESPVVIGAGYYLVEIKSLNLAQSNFIDNQENRGNISAIVSTQYNQNDSITGFADSGIPYVHRGTPALISSANVRILDPISKQVPINLGPNNTVFLQVDSTAPIYTGVPVQAKNMNSPTQTQLQGK
jgi:hypothetical protein